MPVFTAGRLPIVQRKNVVFAEVARPEWRLR
jgi:hypothetical protein